MCVLHVLIANLKQALAQSTLTLNPGALQEGEKGREGRDYVMRIQLLYYFQPKGISDGVLTQINQTESVIA